MENKMPKGTYSIPAKEGILTIIAVLITATLIEMDADIILLVLSGTISIVMFLLCMIYCYSRQISYIRKKITKKEKTLD